MMEWIVTSSAMILIVIALRGLLKGKISLRLQYGLWALVLVRLLLPFSIVDSAISISNVLSDPVIREADTAVSDYRDSYEALRDEYYSRGEAVTDDDIRAQVQQELFTTPIPSWNRNTPIPAMSFPRPRSRPRLSSRYRSSA